MTMPALLIRTSRLSIFADRPLNLRGVGHVQRQGRHAFVRML
jgi:hypothetical protein